MAPVVAIRGWRTRQGYDWVTDGRLVFVGLCNDDGHASLRASCPVRESNPVSRPRVGYDWTVRAGVSLGDLHRCCSRAAPRD